MDDLKITLDGTERHSLFRYGMLLHCTLNLRLAIQDLWDQVGFSSDEIETHGISFDIDGMKVADDKPPIPDKEITLKGHTSIVNAMSAFLANHAEESEETPLTAGAKLTFLAFIDKVGELDAQAVPE